MRCKHDFIDDRICDMCKLVNSNEYEECKKQHHKRKELNKKLFEIQKKCPYRKIDWDEYYSFYSCIKDGEKMSRFANRCEVCLECEKYIKS